MRKETGIVPRALQNRPLLNRRQAYYYTVFQNLSGSRAVSMAGALPIQVSEILAYCTLFKIDPLHERVLIFRYVTEMDSVFLAHLAKKQAQASKPAPK